MSVTQFTRYSSTDASAPRIAGTAGDVTSALDLMLVATGYGSKSPPSPAWTINQTGTNKRIYVPGAGTTAGFRINDAAAGTGGAKEALIRGGEVWSDVDTNTSGPFPTNAQSALTQNGLVIRKSSTASTTATVWKCFADSRTCYLFIQTADNASNYMPAWFGNFYSFVPSDPYTGMLIARFQENVGTVTTSNDLGAALESLGNTQSAMGGHYSQRSFAGTGGSINFLKFSGIPMMASFGNVAQLPMNGVLNYPNGPDGGLWISRIFHADPTTGGTKNIRGWLRGLWVGMHSSTNFADGDTVSGTGALAGRTFEIVKTMVGPDGNSTSYVLVETSNTVEV